MISGVYTYPNMLVNINNTFIGHRDDVGDIDYIPFMPKMNLYRYNLSLDVGESIF